MAWIVAAILTSVWARGRYFALPENYFAHFSSKENHDILKGSELGNRATRITVVHFIDEACPCSRFSESHVVRLEDRFDDTAAFFRWPKVPAELKDTEIDISVPASPAVAIWDSEGKLAYLGPYSSGIFCGEGEDFVSATLTSLLEGNVPYLNEHDALGCFCPWRHRDSSSAD